VVFCAVLAILTGCGEVGRLPTDPGDADPVDPSATLSRVQSEVFTPSCTFVGCHEPLGRAQDLLLTEGNSYANIVGQASKELPQLDRVAPGNPDQSYLYWKIPGRPGITGDRMPQGLPSLSSAQIDLIRSWIRRGAPND